MQRDWCRARLRAMNYSAAVLTAAESQRHREACRVDLGFSRSSSATALFLKGKGGCACFPREPAHTHAHPLCASNQFTLLPTRHETQGKTEGDARHGERKEKTSHPRNLRSPPPSSSQHPFFLFSITNLLLPGGRILTFC